MIEPLLAAAAAAGAVTALATGVLPRAREVRSRGPAARRLPDPPDHRAGAAVALVGVGMLVEPVLALAAGLGTLTVARWRRAPRTRRRAEVLVRDLPDLADLLLLACGAGHTVATSLPAIAAWAPPAAAADLRTAVRRLHLGEPLARVVDLLGERWGEPGRPLVGALADHVRYGTPLEPALDRAAGELRRRRRRHAEARARRLPVTLLFPLVLCTLPAFGLLTVAPLLAGSLLSLDDAGVEAPASPTTPS